MIFPSHYVQRCYRHWRNMITHHQHYPGFLIFSSQYVNARCKEDSSVGNKPACNPSYPFRFWLSSFNYLRQMYSKPRRGTCVCVQESVCGALLLSSANSAEVRADGPDLFVDRMCVCDQRPALPVYQ